MCNYCANRLVGGKGKGTKGLWNHIRVCKEKPEGLPIDSKREDPAQKKIKQQFQSIDAKKENSVLAIVMTLASLYLFYCCIQHF